MARPKAGDPLLNALISKLPAPGSEWPADARKAWLHLMELAFATVYVGKPVGRPASFTDNTQIKRGNLYEEYEGYPFYIDKDGFARRGNGKRVKASQVNAEITDLRVNGDMRTITWADDSQGVAGLDLTIVEP